MFTSGPWEASHHTNLRTFQTPKAWEIVKHNFPNYPYEGDLEEEYGIYPPLGELGPVALVAGEANAHLIAAAPELLEACKKFEGIMVQMSVQNSYEQTWSQFPSGLLNAWEDARAAIAAATGENGAEK